MPSNSSARLRLGFAGTPAFAAVILQPLLEGHDVQVAYCQPARPQGRGRKLTQSAVEQLARAYGIDVRSPRSLRNEAAELERYGLDALIVAAYGLILPKQFLEVPRHGCINVHASLLPRWRGAAPIERAIMAADRVTGISIMQMDEGLDTGPVLAKAECPIRSDDTGDSLRDRLAVTGAQLLIDFLNALGTTTALPQPTIGITYATKLSLEESRIDWSAPAVEIALKIRALNSRQPAFCFSGDERIRLLFAEAFDPATSIAGPPGSVLSIGRTGLVVACQRGSIRITRVALSRGQGKPMDIPSLINGYSQLIRPGQVLG